LSGIIGQLTKNDIINQLTSYWLLFFIVFIGGQIGNLLNLKLFSTRTLALITGCLVIFVAFRMGFRIFS